MNYKEFNDYELLYLIKEESEEAYDILEKKYNPLITKVSKNYSNYTKNNGVDLLDFVQEGKLGLFDAIKNYTNSDVTFMTFAYRCINDKIGQLNRKILAKKNCILNNAMDNNSKIKKKEIELDNIIGIKESYINIFMNEVKKQLTKEEFLLLSLRINGYTMTEIAFIINSNAKKVAYKYKNVKNKLEKYWKKC